MLIDKHKKYNFLQHYHHKHTRRKRLMPPMHFKGISLFLTFRIINTPVSAHCAILRAHTSLQFYVLEETQLCSKKLPLFASIR